MAVKLMMEHPNTGIIKRAPIGYSVTTLLFGPFPALLRGDWKWAVIMALLDGTGILWLVFPFLYNKLYVKQLLGKGFKVLDAEGDSVENIKRKLSINLPTLTKG
jgi:hypothetical protein